MTSSVSSAKASVVHTCLFYADSQLCTRVVPVIEKLIRRYRRIDEFQLYLLPFDALDQDHFADRARTYAGFIDVVVLVGELKPPPEFLRWLELWDKNRNGESNRLLVLFRSPGDEEHGLKMTLFRQMSDFAANSGVSFVLAAAPESRQTA